MIRRFKCGWRVNPGNVEGLAETLRTLVAQPERVREAGSRARAAFLEHYDRDGSVKRLCRSIAALRPQRERGDLARAAHVPHVRSRLTGRSPCSLRLRTRAYATPRDIRRATRLRG